MALVDEPEMQLAASRATASNFLASHFRPRSAQVPQKV